MGLSNDQKAILRLLSQRGEQGYDDLSALMGIDAGEVHERARAAAAQLEAEGIPAAAIPPPPGAAAAEETPPAPAMPPPPAAPMPPPPSPPPGQPRARRPKPSLPSSGGARAAIAAGAAVVVLVIVLLATGGSDSGDGGSTAAGENAAAAEGANVSSGNAELTQAALDPVDGSDASGTATFGRIKNKLALQVEATGLAPTGKGESYTVWLYQSADKMLPLASTPVGDSGKIGAQLEVPTEVLAYLANEAFDQIDVSLTSDAALKASLAKATNEKKAPIYTGTDVLRGKITGPIIGAAKKSESE
ncbi:MAG TPA: hypothetical protein VGO36_06980 [Solirubrobacterales bacterium]|jgi:hypothetical protein|nr:hypothetical protein [Solirubrobacterales bacterium]